MFIGSYPHRSHPTQEVSNDLSFVTCYSPFCHVMLYASLRIDNALNTCVTLDTCVALLNYVSFAP